ncbi:serine protease Do-like HtrB [Clostridium homopropionicum DSM 5847]|uniref:Serine protease Do-like HtrB n=1 Tax=Clostridium homopropionicum DSM 5847 TaxID=1121318 RepID=A0A0L6Z744_9CLOT|nr:trypsin-like peptidase domain-containing protein [Clostridium homopropionicum]KOA18782.1 serine protease Do-like HtrB [Clostridium homopropionicum DSM 5847]SFG77362.1 serine protease Do [Clostridium homopropionicum]
MDDRNDGVNERDNIEEVSWEDVNKNKCGEIKFIKKKNPFKNFFRLVSFVLIAVLSGAITSNYIIEKRYSELLGNSSKNTGTAKNNISLEESKISSSNDEIAKVAEKVGPTVVGIVKTSKGSNLGIPDKSSGSGIIFDTNGYIVTNYHVIQDAENILVKLANGINYINAKLIGSDPTSDLAVVKIDAKNLPTAKFGDSSKVRVGDLAIAIGNPLGEELAGTVTAGIISARNRKIQYGGAIYKVLQTDAAINPGNSGGALCNSSGEVIGINSLKLTDSQFQDVEGIGFAISINEANGIIQEIMKYGRVARPRLGIYGRNTILEDSSEVKGVYVSEVIKDSGAEKAGVIPGDIIVQLDGKSITQFEDITEIIEKHKIGDVVSGKIWRKGKTINIKITLTDINIVK